MTLQQLQDILILLRAPGLSRRDAGRLVQHAGSVERVFASSPAELAACGLKRDTIQALLRREVTDDIRRELDFVQKREIRTLGFWEPDYPPLLRECPDAPVMLFAEGSFDFSTAPLAVSIVGTRSITPYGMAATEQIVQALTPYRPILVSGLAYGVDGQAHRMALKYGLPTVGVLGQGLGTALYPAQNRDTARRMCQTPGCGVLTEYPHSQQALPGLFPARNRIVAGISRATVVVEAKAKGGALITANLACGYNREVFAVPGRMNDPCSAGCNALIRENKALITDDPQTLIRELGWDTADKGTSRTKGAEKPIDLFSEPSVSEATKLSTDNPSAIHPQYFGTPAPAFSTLDETSRRVLQTLAPVEKMHVDQLADTLQLPIHRLSSLLLELELAGLLDALPGKYYALGAAGRK